MSVRAPVEKLSSEKHFELASSPHVNIHVGPEGEEKIYSLPRDLIAYYSPYFASCFKNNWKEANEGILRLPDESSEFFDVLVDYFRHGEAKLKVPKYDVGWPWSEDWQASLRMCFEFIRFTDMYDINEANGAVVDTLTTIFAKRRFDDCVLTVGTDEFQLCVERLHPRNKVLNLIANVCVRTLAGECSEQSHCGGANTSSDDIYRLIDSVPKLAAAMWRQVGGHYSYEKPEWKKVAFQLSNQPV